MKNNSRHNAARFNPLISAKSIALLLLVSIGQLALADTELENAIDSLAQHVSGTDTVSDTQLYAVRDIIVEKTEADTLDGNAALTEKAYNTIKSYESSFGALFTAEGTQSFSTDDSNSDGMALERTMHSLYLAVFDTIDLELIASDADLVDGLEFGSASYFPGAVPAPTDPNAIYEVHIHASVPEDWGRPNLYSKLPARRPTGAYLAAGTIAEVIVPAALVNSGYQVRVGAHSWDLSSRGTQKRLARATKLFPITSAVTQVANPLGGNIYIEVPYLADDGMVNVQIKNSIRSPYFSARSFDQIAQATWQNSERIQPGAWTDIETDTTMMSVPSKWVRDFSYTDMMELLNEYDAHMNLVSDYMGKPHTRNKPIVFMQVDVILRGTAFFPGYPMGNYPSFTSTTPQAPLKPGHSLDQTFLHEHGHATYMTKFSNETESVVHMLYPYIQTQLYGMPIQEAFSSSLHYNKSTERPMDDIFISWALRDSFINDVDMNFPNAAYKHRGHADLIQYADLFGWSALTEFNRQLNVDYVESGYDFERNNHENNDRLLRLSREAGADIRPLFHLWGHSPNDQTALQAALDAEDLKPSAKIYDLMVAYKPAIPLAQADYNAWYTRMDPVLFSGHKTDFWDPLEASYDLSRAQDALNRIDTLIDLYFPDGRPSYPVIAYQSENYSGTEWNLDAAVYDFAGVSASPIGNDKISSIQISPGYEVTLCQHSNGSGNCETYTSSTPQLGSMNNQASYVTVAQISQETIVERFPKDLQLYPRDIENNQATVAVSGVIGTSSTEVTLDVYRNNTLWNSWTQNASDSSTFDFAVQLPAELVNFEFQLTETTASNSQTTVANASEIVAGDVFVINGQSNAASGIYSLSDASTEDANDFVRTYGGWGADDWVDNDDWHIVQPECRPLSQSTACVGRWGLRMGSELVANTQVPVAIINQARGGASIDYFAKNNTTPDDLTSNYGRLLARLENGGLAENIRALLWYQGESDRTDNQAHFDQFTTLFGDWEIQYPSIEKYYIFQIRHTCVATDIVFGQGTQISNFQREFANARDNVVPVSTTGLDAHDGCHYGYVGGYQTMGDNISRILRSDLYGEALDNADAADIVTAIRTDANTIELTFSDNNTLIADNGFEALFDLRDRNNIVNNITSGSVHNGVTVLLTTESPIEENDELTLSYVSLSGDQNWLTNNAGIGILSFSGFSVDTTDSSEPTEPTDTATPVDTDIDGVPDSIEIAENTDPSDSTVYLDTDGDGIADYNDADSDGDGNWNLHEAGSHPYYDRDRDGIPAYLDDNDFDNRIGDFDDAVEALFDPDNNGIADFQDNDDNGVDTDGDGVPDRVETADATITTDASNYLDFDNDRIPDYLDEDDDNDDIPDAFEGGSDIDGDGIANQFDTDSDGDGTDDSVEGITDLDGDLIPNVIDNSTASITADPDQDNDGIADDVEGSDDADQDGIANNQDTDSDNDQLSDLVETNADTDGDGVPNFLDDDSDGDTISDLIEGMGDIDEDLLGNAVDHDSDADEIPDSVELTADTDSDGVPNYVDSDSDGDGIGDQLEGVTDTDGDGIVDYLDNDTVDEATSPPLTVGVSGAGCALVSASASIDPMLLLIVMVSMTGLWRRRRLG